MNSNGYASASGVGNNASRADSRSRNFYDEEKDDPIQVDGVLTEELMRLSVQDRNDFQEEIHGVRCLAPEESPQLIKESLELLQWELEHNIPVHEKQAYLRSQHPPLHLTSHKNQKNCRNPSNPAAMNPNHTYVNSDGFRLRFLRYELFDVHKAALRICRFLDLALESFGDFALRRPIRLSDFSKHEMKHIRKGKYQYLPYRDRGGVAGRRVLCVFPDEEWEAIAPYLRSKIMMYTTWVAGNDVDVQREGLIYLVWFDKTFKVSKKPFIQAREHEVVSVRAAAIHCLSPDTPHFRFRRSIMTMRLGRHNRTRLNTLLGESVELRYKLNAFGIDSEQIPITYSGKIKVVYFKQWLKVRELIEQAEEASMHKRQYNHHQSKPNNNGSLLPRVVTPTSVAAETMIESPYLSDVIFRKGASLVLHAGNVTLRTLVVAKARKELMLLECTPQQNTGNSNTSNINATATTTIPKKTGRFVEEIIEELREIGRDRIAKQKGKPCRFLVWNEHGWWEELVQEHEIHTRVEYIARGIRNTVIKNYKKVSNFAATASVTTVNSASSSTIAPVQLSSSVAAADPNASNPLAVVAAAAPITQHQNGGTSIFRSMDNSSSAGNRKKRRLVSMSGEEDNANDSNGAGTRICGEAECFGMKFNWTNN